VSLYSYILDLLTVPHMIEDTSADAHNKLKKIMQQAEEHKCYMYQPKN